jgi:hypothetical protein
LRERCNFTNLAFCLTNVFQLTPNVVYKKSLKIPKGLTRNCKSKKDRQYNGQIKRTKRQTMIYKTLHRKQKIEHHEATLKIGVELR